MEIRGIPIKDYELVVQHLKEIVQPRGAWDNDLKNYLSNVIKLCIEHARSRPGGLRCDTFRNSD